MKLKKMIQVEVIADNVKIFVPVRYGTEVIPDDFPGRKNDMLMLCVDIDSGVIRDWPKDYGDFELYMKVCDEGSYWIRDKSGEVIHGVETDYVPSFIPGDYGDYIDLKIDATGKITNWPSMQDFQDLFQIVDE